MPYLREVATKLISLMAISCILTKEALLLVIPEMLSTHCKSQIIDRRGKNRRRERDRSEDEVRRDFLSPYEHN